jgi:hypothetical protein
MEGEITFTEAAIFMTTSGRRAGHYIARCARENCGYFGKLYSYPPKAGLVIRKPVPLENKYDQIGVPLWSYPRRGIIHRSVRNDCLLIGMR